MSSAEAVLRQLLISDEKIAWRPGGREQIISWAEEAVTGEGAGAFATVLGAVAVNLGARGADQIALDLLRVLSMLGRDVRLQDLQLAGDTRDAMSAKINALLGSSSMRSAPMANAMKPAVHGKVKRGLR